jgi:hypothetical protein
MNKPAILLALAIVFVGSGCTTAPSYLPYDREKMVGFLSEKKTEDSYFVTFKGNEGSSASQVRDLTLLRCAEIAKENSAPFFIIEKELDVSAAKKPSQESSNSSNTPTTLSGNTGAFVRGTAASSDASDETSGDRFAPETSETKTPPAYSILIKLLKTKLSTSDKIYTSEEVIAELRAKYKLGS